ncbi:MAG: hypothetical protein PHT94_01600 [Candidatus Nanoarchaeia archaeon]|nr:hypothetical protein [Candidatus Nanoarchaeia archaeon]
MSINDKLIEEKSFVFNKYFFYPFLLLSLFFYIFLPWYFKFFYVFIIGVYLDVLKNQAMSHDNYLIYFFVIFVLIFETLFLVRNFLYIILIISSFFLGIKLSKKIENLFKV